MPINLEKHTDAELRRMGIDPTLRKNFTQVPTLEELKPTAREMHYLEVLRAWEKESERSTIVLGVPEKYHRVY